jgi:chromate reductase
MFAFKFCFFVTILIIKEFNQANNKLNKLLIISGTNRSEALSPMVAEAYVEQANKQGLEAEIIDLRDLPKDFTATALYGNAGKNESFNALREKMKQAQKFVFIVPEYNGSFPGVLKAFIDGLDFPDTFTGKKAALIGVSAGMLGSSHAMSHFTDILNYCGTHVLARKPRLTRISAAIEDGKLTNESYLDQIQKQTKELIKF